MAGGTVAQEFEVTVLLLLRAATCERTLQMTKKQQKTTVKGMEEGCEGQLACKTR